MTNRVRHGKRLYKQMSLEVAVRNPERYPAILEVFNRFENQILDDNCILEIYKELFVSKAIDSNKLDVENSTETEIKFFIKKNLRHNNEWGFPTGYQAAFTRYLKTLSELGFIYMQYNEKIRISPVAKALLNKDLEVSEAFALQCMKFWRKSPYRRVLNDFNYFKFILTVLIKLKEQRKSLSYPQFILSLFSDDGNVEEFITKINSIKLGNNIDSMYEYIVKSYNHMDNFHTKVNKQQTVVNDYGNTVFRVLQLTGLISVENKSGIILLSINDNRYEFMKYLLGLDFQLTEQVKEDELLYFNKLGYIDKSSIAMIASCRNYSSNENYNEILDNIIRNYNINEKTIIEMIKSVSNDSDKLFWYIQKPLKLEFFIAIFIYLKFGNEFKIRPNYKADDKGIPYQHAPGNVGDITISSNTINWLIEVTLIRNKTQQLNNETANCIRHLLQSFNTKNYLSFVAPVVCPDTYTFYDNSIINMIINDNDNCFIKAYDFDNFISITQSKKNFIDMENKRNEILTKLKHKFS